MPFFKWVVISFCVLLSLFQCRHAAPDLPPVQTVAEFDLHAYLGHWYEVASLPNPYQRGCVATEATYTPGDKDRIKIINACRKGQMTAPKTQVVGKGWQPDKDHPAQLKVQLFWPFVGDYWVLGHAPDYSWAVVGQPSRRYLWFLCRSAHVSETVLDQMKKIAQSQYYDLTHLSLTPQAP